MPKYLNLISYFGGKYLHLPWLLDKFPKGNYHFVDAMCGAANVALNVNYPLITINDLNDNVINLFKVMRDDPDELLRRIYFTPFARAEINSLITDFNDITCPIERARRFYVRSQLGYGANGSQNNHKGFGSEYKIQPSNFYRVDNWNLKFRKFADIVQKLREIQIENRDVFDLIDRVNSPDVILYIDPPYLFSTRSSRKRYTHEWDEAMHIRLAEKVSNARCFVANSGYDSDLYNDLYKVFHKTTGKLQRVSVKKKLNREILWSNYDPTFTKGVMKLFN